MTELRAAVAAKKALLDELRPLSTEALASLEHVPAAAFMAHLRLVNIHPFNDGNGRTARLLMNLLLIRSGYPPIAVRPEDRLAYVKSLQEAQAGKGNEGFEALLYGRLDQTLADYLKVLSPTESRPRNSPGLL